MKLKQLDPTQATDYRRITGLWEAAGLTYKPEGRDHPDAIKRQMAGGAHTFLGLENEGGQLIGMVLTTHDGRKGWINRVAVHPDCRRQGIGLRLIEAAEETLQAQGMRIIAAQAEPDNAASVAMLTKAGYIEWEGLHYFSKREDKDV